MMVRRTFLAAVLIGGLVSAAFATDFLTPDQVRLLTLKAADLIAANDIDKAREKFHAPGEFRAGEIYVGVIDTNGTWLVYPPNPRNEGKSALNVKDQNGMLVVQEILKLAAEKGQGWIEYRWLNPATNKIQPKVTYVARVNNRNMVTYIGVYKSE